MNSYSILFTNSLFFTLLLVGTNALQSPSSQTRREIFTSSPYKILASATGTVALLNPKPRNAQAVTFDQPSNPTNTLAIKLSKRDASVLKNPIFNKPPQAQTYPEFMQGDWNVSLKFAGFLFPSQTIPKDKIVSNASIPGFQKCSIAAMADVGRDLTTYKMSISKEMGLEDRMQTLKTSIDAHLGGYSAVTDVLYDPSSNPNRLSINFDKYKTRNAERIELFCNARESELVRNPNDDKLSIFLASEYIRQVTFSLSQEFGVAREVIGNYAHFWTWREQPDGNTMTGNVLTSCYLDPQDAMFFQEPSKPVAVYSHQITATRL